MKFIKQSIQGVYLIEPDMFKDERGVFRRHFCQKEFLDVGIETNISQSNVSENRDLHTLRGFHYQLSPHREGKTISCFSGAIYDIVVDLRPSSSTYLKWISFELTPENRKSLHIPPGCANSFFTLKKDTVLHYYSSYQYTPEAERGIRYNDPLFKFKWPCKPKVISEKDSSFPNFVPQHVLSTSE